MFGFFLWSQGIHAASPEVERVSFDSFWQSSQLGPDRLYLFCEDGDTQIVERSGCVLYALGTLVIGRTWGKRALTRIAEQLLSGRDLGQIMREARGQYCLVARWRDMVFIVTDWMASFPIYRVRKGSSIQITNVLPTLLRHNKITLDRQGLAEYLSFSYCLRGTCFQGIELLEQGTIHQMGKEYVKRPYREDFSNLDFEKCTNLDEASRRVETQFIENISFLADGGKPFLDITGGFDGRFTCTLLRSLGVDFATGICGEQVPREAHIARTVAQKLGVEFRDDFRIHDLELFRETVRTHKRIASGVPIPFHSSELIHYYERIKQNHPIHCTGFGGSQTFFSWIRNLGFLSSKVNISALSDKLFPYLDIFPETTMTRRQFQSCVGQKIQALLDQIGSDCFTHVSNYLGLFIFNKWYHGCLINTHNCILPIYSPYLEANLFRLLTETAFPLKRHHRLQKAILTRRNPEVSLVMTTHGYTANLEVADFWAGLKRTARDTMRRVIYQSRFLRNCRWWLDQKANRGKPRPRIADTDRQSWVREVLERFDGDTAIYEVVDRKKVQAALSGGAAGYILLAKLAYLEDMIRDHGVRTGA
jgi:hypothetical protein